MDVVICDICEHRIDPVNPLRFVIPMFQNPERFTMEEIDLCMACGLEFSSRYVGLKNERHTIRK